MAHSTTITEALRRWRLRGNDEEDDNEDGSCHRSVELRPSLELTADDLALKSSLELSRRERSLPLAMIINSDLQPAHVSLRSNRAGNTNTHTHTHS